MTVTDKYDTAVKYLESNPEDIDAAWEHPWKSPAGCLFAFVGRSSKKCGCLTQIRQGDKVAVSLNGEEDLDLTEKIQADERIPKSPKAVSVEDLPIFAEWQRKLDQIYGKANRTHMPDGYWDGYWD